MISREPDTGIHLVFEIRLLWYPMQAPLSLLGYILVPNMGVIQESTALNDDKHSSLVCTDCVVFLSSPSGAVPGARTLASTEEEPWEDFCEGFMGLRRSTFQMS